MTEGEIVVSIWIDLTSRTPSKFCHMDGSGLIVRIKKAVPGVIEH